MPLNKSTTYHAPPPPCFKIFSPTYMLRSDYRDEAVILCHVCQAMKPVPPPFLAAPPPLRPSPPRPKSGPGVGGNPAYGPLLRPPRGCPIVRCTLRISCLCSLVLAAFAQKMGDICVHPII